MEKTINRKRLLQTLFTAYIVLIPFAAGPTTRYLLSTALIVLSWLLLLEDHPRYPVLSPAGFLRSPVAVSLILLDIIALFSIFYSPEPIYSLQVFFEDFFLNTFLFISIAILSANHPEYIRWERSILLANIIFLAAYMGLMVQWIIFPAHPLFSWPDQIQGPLARWDAVFAFGNGCRVFHGIKHTSLFLTLLLAFWTATAALGMISWKETSIFFLDLFTLVTTTRRAAALAVLSGFAAALIFFRKKSGLLKLSMLFLAGLGALIILSGNTKHFVRENWQLIFRGEIEKARELGGSIPLRVSTYKTFSREVLSDPFRPRGIGKKLIKEYRPELVKKAGLLHGHNTFLNYAYYLGIQGAAALAAILAIQVWLFMSCWKKSSRPRERLLMATALIFMLMFWGTNMFTDGFLHGSATLYWLFTAVPVGVALRYRYHPDQA